MAADAFPEPRWNIRLISVQKYCPAEREGNSKFLKTPFLGSNHESKSDLACSQQLNRGRRNLT
jgi:hypothetical protein